MARTRSRAARAAVVDYVRRCATTIGGVLLLLWAILGVNTALFGGTLNGLGVVPRTAHGLVGIPLMPLLHASAGHLLANSLGIALFGSLVFLREQRDFWIVAAVGTLVGGLGVWLVGHTGLHIGASGVVFAWFGYLLSAGWFERRFGMIAMSALLFFFWGSVLWGLFPLQRGISWEGHLFGLLGGILAARMLARRRVRGTG